MLDTFVYSYAAAHHQELRLHLYTKAKWDELLKQYGHVLDAETRREQMDTAASKAAVPVYEKTQTEFTAFMTGIICEMRRIVTSVIGDEQQASAVVFALMENFGGERLYIPSNDYETRNREMISLHAQAQQSNSWPSATGYARKPFTG